MGGIIHRGTRVRQAATEFSSAITTQITGAHRRSQRVLLLSVPKSFSIWQKSGTGAGRRQGLLQTLGAATKTSDL